MKARKKVVTLSRDEMRTVIGGGLATSPMGVVALRPVPLVDPTTLVGESNPQPSPSPMR